VTDEQANKVADAIGGHGNDMGRNLVHLKRFLADQQVQQQKFFSQLQAASDKAQRKAALAALWSAIAAGAAAIAASFQAYDAWITP
jgi:hypothetical protein